MKHRKVKVGELVELVNGFPFTPGDWETDGKKIIRIQNLNNDKIGFNRTNRLVAEKYLVTKGDLLISWSGTLGVFEWSDEVSLLNQHIFKVNFKNNLIDKAYFKFVIKQALIELSGKTRGLGLKHLKKNQIDNYEFNLPPLDVQQISVNYLNKLQSLINKRFQTVQLLNELIRSRYFEMFGDPIVNNRRLNRRSIMDLPMRSGATPSRANEQFFNGQINWVKSSDIRNEEIYSTEEKISDLGLANSSCTIFPINTVLIAMYGDGKTRGRVGILKIEAAANQACAAIIPNEYFHPTFLFCSLKYSYDFLRSLGKGANRKNMSLSVLNGILINEPNLQDQVRFDAIYNRIQMLVKPMQKSLDLFEEFLQARLYETFKPDLEAGLDEIDVLIEDDIRIEEFINSFITQDISNDELYEIEFEKLITVLDRTEHRNNENVNYRKGIVQRLINGKVGLVLNRDYKNQLFDEDSST